MISLEIEHVASEEARYWVQAATAATQDENTVELLFQTEAPALNAAKKLAQEFSWVKVSEKGEWQLRTGKSKKGWVAFWWTKECGYEGDPPDVSGKFGVRDGESKPKPYKRSSI